MKALIQPILISVTLLCMTLTGYSQTKPKAVYQVGQSKVTVWENEKEGEFGKFTAKNFKVEKIYQKDGKWKSTNTFSLTELIALKAAIDAAIIEQGVKIRKETEEETEPTKD